MNSDDAKLRLIEVECVRWLRDVRYWLGFVAGKYEGMVGADRNVSTYCDVRNLQFGWKGRIVSIYGVKGSDFEEILSLCSSNILDFFSFKLDAVCGWSDFGHRGNKKYTDLIELLILDSFPGISQLNTWGLCDYMTSDLCGKMGVDICISIDDKMCCLHCLEAIEARRVSVLNGSSVYIFGDRSSGVYKIGYSKKPEKRIKAFATKLPYKIELLHRILVDSNKAETVLHKYFAEKRLNGEWFTLSSTELEWLSTIKKYENGKFFDLSGEAVLLS